jgi:hypothetical protein
VVRLTGARDSVFSVARRYLPGELLGRVRVVKNVVGKRSGRGRKRGRTELEVVDEVEED